MVTFKSMIASGNYLRAIHGRTRRRTRRSRVTAFESLENRMLLTVLGTDPLIFDPTPANASSGDEVDIGEIKYELEDISNIKVTYSIDAAFRAVYDLSAVETRIQGGHLGTISQGELPANTETFTHTLSLALYPPLSASSLDIDACATIEKLDVGAVGEGLPTVGTVIASTNGLLAGVPSYFDTILTPGRIPTSTDIGADTVTFASDPGWDTGAAVRVVQGYTAAPPNTGLVTPPTVTDDTNSATYFVRNLGEFTYSFHTTYNDAVAAINLKDITAAVPTTGEIIIAGENDALAFLGQTPINESFIPTSTKTTLTTNGGPGVSSFNGTTEQIVVESTAILQNGDRVRVSAAFGGLNITTTYYARVIDGTTVELYNSYAAAVDIVSSSGRIGLSGTGVLAPPYATSLNTIDPNDETVKFASESVPDWTTGTPVRVSGAGGGLSAGTTYFARSLGGGVYSFFDTRANADNSDPDSNPFNGRKDLTASITASVFANLNTLSFRNDHNWAMGTVVRVGATGGGLIQGTNYYVRAIGARTISLHTSLTYAQENTSPVTFTAPITALVTPMFDGWCIDNDRFIGGSEYIANFFSSYETSSFPDTTDHPKDQFGTDAGLMPVNTSATPSSTDYTTNERATFTTTSSLGWADNQAVRVVDTTGGGALEAGTTYYIDVFITNATSTVVSFHTATPVVAGNKVNLLGDVAEAVFRAESIDFAATTNWPNGTKVRVDVDNGGLVAGTNYYVRQQNTVGGLADTNSVSFYTTREYAQAGGTIGLITLTDPMETTTKVYVPENLVENPENLDVMNWVLNQNFQSQLAIGQTPTATNIATTTTVPASTSDANVGTVPNFTDFTTTESVNYLTDPGFVTATLVRVTATGGGLTAGNNYFIRNLGGGSYSFYNSADNATAGTSTGRSNLTANITAGVFIPSLASTEDTVTFNPGHDFVTGSVVNVNADGGGLDASNTYYLYNVSGDTFSFHTAAAATAANKVNLTAAIAAAVHLQSDDTVTMTASPNYGWTTGMRVRVSATGGVLTADTDYYIRAINATTLAFYTTAADASNNVNRIDLNAAITDTVRPYYTEGDVQRTVWELIENNPGNPGHSQTRVNEIMALADAAVGLNDANVTFVPDCDGTVAVIIQPFEVEKPSTNQITIAQITIAQIPNYCATATNCQTLTVNLGSISGMKFEDMNGDGDNEEGGDPGLAGWTIFVDYDGDLAKDDNEPSAVTATGGRYLITGLVPGTWNVYEVQQKGWVQTTAPVSVTVEVSVHEDPAPEAVDVLFGNFELFDLSGVKVWDVDRDGATGGIGDTGDGRLANLVVLLDEDGDKVRDWTDAADLNGIFNGVWDEGEGERWTTTNDKGEYSFHDLGPSSSGSYDVVEDLMSLNDSDEWQPTTAGGDKVTVTATSGTDATANFYNHKFKLGEYRTYSLGGYQGNGTPGQYLLANFVKAFPSGLVVPRQGYDIVLTTAAQVQAFLKAKTSTTLEKQFVALSLSVGFDAYDEAFSTGTANLGDLKLCNLEDPYDTADGLTVSEYLAQVALYLGGSATTLSLSSGELTFLLNNITLGFDNGVVSSWAERHLC